MTFINYAAREINCKIVYYGPGLCGKTTNLQWIYDKTNPQAKGKLISLAAQTAEGSHATIAGDPSPSSRLRMTDMRHHGLNIVAIGGGTGLSTLLRGLKRYVDANGA